MKTSSCSLTASVIAMAASLMTAGCYTEFALTDSDPAGGTEPQTIYIDQPIIIVHEPGPAYLDPTPAYLPTGGVTAPGTVNQGGGVAPSRDTGRRRTPPPPAISTPRPVAPPSRSGGSIQPTPAPSAPAHTAAASPSRTPPGRK